MEKLCPRSWEPPSDYDLGRYSGPRARKLHLKVPALRLVNVSKEVISVIEENSIAKSTIDATEFGGKLFSTQIWIFCCFSLQRKRNFGERVLSKFILNTMAAIFNFNGSGRLGRGINLYQEGGRRSKIRRGVGVGEWRLRVFSPLPRPLSPPAPYPHRLLLLQIKHSRSNKRSRAFSVSSHQQDACTAGYCYFNYINQLKLLAYLDTSDHRFCIKTCAMLYWKRIGKYRSNYTKTINRLRLRKHYWIVPRRLFNNIHWVWGE